MKLWATVKTVWKIGPIRSYKAWRELRRVSKAWKERSMEKPWYQQGTVIAAIIGAIAKGLVLFGFIEKDAAEGIADVFSQAWVQISALISLVADAWRQYAARQATERAIVAAKTK